MRQEREKATDATLKAGSAASREIGQLREELTKAKASVQDLSGKVTKVSYILLCFRFKANLMIGILKLFLFYFK